MEVLPTHATPRAETYRQNRTAFLFAEPEWKPKTKDDIKAEVKAEAPK